MKKSIFTLIALTALMMCSCEKEPTDPNGNTTPDEPVIDITPYLGKYLMTRHTDLTITALNMFTFPLDRDLDVETVTIKSDPQVEHGIIMSSSDGLYLRGVVDTAGLHLQNDTIAITIDTTVLNFPLNFSASVSMTHPVIQPPVDGKMEWVSVAEGTASTTILGMPVSATITGDMRYRTVFSK
ncbi:MAG: hypothetical protein IJK84_05065 [Bacteroidales bacterium]|nr:hypothetical protein [Bacteroidales bacterium]